MAEENKKAKKLRSTKKAGAGTELTVEKQEEEKAVETAEKQETTVKSAKTKSAKPKKTAAEKTAKKTAEEAPATDVQEKPSVEEKATQEEKPVEKQPAEKKPKAKRAAKKTASAEEEKTQETVAGETPAAVVETAQKADEAVAKKEPETAEKSEKPAPKVKEKKTQEKEKTVPEKAVDGAKKSGAKKPAPTKAEKRDFVKKLTREILLSECKWAELIDRVAQGYKEAYPIPENDNLNDVKGRVGSVLHVMQEEGEIVVDGNLVKLSSAEQKTEKEPTVSVLNESEKVETPLPKVEEKPIEKQENTQESSSQTAGLKTEAATPAPLYDLSLLFGKKNAKKAEEAPKASVEEVAKEKSEELAKTKKSADEKLAKKLQEKAVARQQEKPIEKPLEKEKAEEKPQLRKEVPTRRPTRSAKADPLKEQFLKKLRSLGGNYFEYYAIYLLEKYSRMNGRRLEGLRISGGEYDGGIDGELELTDRLGFRETIYVQAKNWEPTDERWWIGETILQQFIGAVTYRQAKEGKQHCRGMFITTSAFTTGAKEMLDKLSDRFVGYDGDELYETAKECQFGILKDEKGNWRVDEDLLSGKKSFFFML